VARTEATTRQATAEQSLAAAHAEADQARARARELEEAVRQTKAVVETAAAEAGGEVEALRSSLAGKTSQCEALTAQLQELNKEHRALEEKMSETELASLNHKDARVTALQDKYDALAAQCREAEMRREQAETSLAAAEQGSSSTSTRLEGELQRNAQLLIMAQNDVAELRTTTLELETELVRAGCWLWTALHCAVLLRCLH
jgi:chromosome segregation ATPase